jgi:hypothetical protein
MILDELGDIIVDARNLALTEGIPYYVYFLYESEKYFYSSTDSRTMCKSVRCILIGETRPRK